MLSSRPDAVNLIAIIGDKICNLFKNQPTIITSLNSTPCAGDVNNTEKDGVGALCADLSCSNSFFVYCDNQKHMRLFNLDGNRLTLDHELTLDKKVGCISFTQDEKHILLGEKSGCVRMFNFNQKSLTSKTVDQDELLGHLSLLTCVVVNTEGNLIGTCDRDEKVRVSRFSQPYIIESFCLGHTKPVSQIAFVDNVHLVSVAGDGFLRLWNGIEGKELDALDTSDVFGKVSDNKVIETFLVSRLLIIGDLIVLGVRSHNYVLAVKLSKDRTSFVRQGGSVLANGVCCPEGSNFVDCCAIQFDGKGQSELVCLMAPITRLISWPLTFDDNSITFGQIEQWNDLPVEIQKTVDGFPRLLMLSEMSKGVMESSGVAAYEAGKAEKHQRIKKRHQRHQTKRKRGKHDANDGSNGVAHASKPKEETNTD